MALECDPSPYRCNSREGEQKVFQKLVTSIRALGLRKPITVTRRGDRYLLICGHSWVEAFRALGRRSMPAMVVEFSDEDAFVRSLVENFARHPPPTMEQIARMEQEMSLMQSRFKAI